MSQPAYDIRSAARQGLSSGIEAGQEESEITQELTRISMQIERLGSSAARLGGRLRPVSRQTQPMPGPGDATKEREPETPLGSELRQIRRMLESIESSLRETDILLAL